MDKMAFQNIKKKLRLTNQGISDVMGVRLRTVQNWADGVWKIPLMAEKFLRTLLSMKKEIEINVAIYQGGYAKGRDEGYQHGYDTAVKEGYMAAKSAVGLD